MLAPQAPFFGAGRGRKLCRPAPAGATSRAMKPRFFLLPAAFAIFACGTSSSSTPAADASVPADADIEAGMPADAETMDAAEHDANDAGAGSDATDAAVAGWKKRLGGTGREVGLVVTTDAEGNVYVAGEFNGTASFGGAALTGKGGSDAFLAKLDRDGNPVWSKGIGGAGDESPTGIA